MIVKYKNEEIRELCTSENVKIRSKVLPKRIEREAFENLIAKLYAASNLNFFMSPENLKHHLEKLSGDRKYQLSLRIKKDSGYRLIFECIDVDINESYEKMTQIRILEFNMHKY